MRRLRPLAALQILLALAIITLLIYGNANEEAKRKPSYENKDTAGKREPSVIFKADQPVQPPPPPPPTHRPSPPPSTPVQQQQHQVHRDGRRVAFTVFLTNVDNERYLDQLAVLAYSIKSAARRSVRNIDAVVLGYEAGIKEHQIPLLNQLGFDRVILVDLPVKLDEISEKSTREELDKHTADLHLITELIKLRGYEMTEYDRVFMIDGDTLVFDPMDELSGADSDDVSLYGTFDYGMHVNSRQRWPPVQGGFLCMKPNKEVYNEMTKIVREQKFCCGQGWNRSMMGWYYGGVGPQGLLSYYYLNEFEEYIKTDIHTVTWRPGRKFVELDQCKYDVLSNHNCLFTRLDDTGKKLAGTTNRTAIRKVCINDQCRHSPSQEAIQQEMAHVHFTAAGHFRPWSDCEKTGDGMPYGTYNNWICRFANLEWWRLRTEMEKEYNLKVSRGYCNRKEKYQPIDWHKE